MTENQGLPIGRVGCVVQCPLCDTFNYFEPEDQFEVDLAIAKCFNCKQMCYGSESTKDWFEGDIGDDGWADIAARGGLEAALEDGRCVTGMSPPVIQGSPLPVRRCL